MTDDQNQPEVTNPCAACGRELDLPMTCRACRSHLRSMLQELPRLYVYASMSLTPDQTGGSGGRGGTKVHAPIPLRLDVLSFLGPAARAQRSNSCQADQDASVPALAMLKEWADLIVGEVCLRPPKPGTRPPGPCHKPSAALDPLLDTLLAHLDYACGRPFAADYISEIKALHRRLRGIARVEVRRRSLNVPCPRCEMYTLVSEDWSAYRAECTVCGALFTADEYQDLVKHALGQAERDRRESEVSHACSE